MQDSRLGSILVVWVALQSAGGVKTARGGYDTEGSLYLNGPWV